VIQYAPVHTAQRLLDAPILRSPFIINADILSTDYSQYGVCVYVGAALLYITLAVMISSQFCYKLTIHSLRHTAVIYTQLQWCPFWVDYKRLKKGVKHLGPDEGDLDQPPTPTHSTACDSEAGGNEVAVVTTQSQQQQQRTAAVAAAASSLSAGAAAAAQRRAASDAGAGGAAAAGGGTAGDAYRYIYKNKHTCIVYLLL
jgi:hypothetical protein